jgi:shikimate 5-dehydrogenase/shikimate kinase
MADQDGVVEVDENGFDALSRHSRLRPPVSGTISPHQHGTRTPSEQQSLRGVQNASTGQETSKSFVKTPTPETSAPGGRRFHPDASFVLVGIRASGKRSLGLIAATALGWRFVTEDHYFQTVNGLSRQDYLKVYGSEQFHRQDIETSKRMLEENKYQCVIDCGLGSLTSGLQDYLRRYSQTNSVVFVVRDMARIKQILNLDARAAKLLEYGNSTHRKCSNYEFYNLEDESSNELADSDTTDRASPTYSFKLRNAQADFSSFVRFIAGKHAADPTLLSPFSLDGPVESRAFTHTLFVSLSDFIQDRVDWGALEAAGDVLEIYVDQFQSSTASALARMVAVARRVLGVPILLSASRNLTETAPLDTYMSVLWQGLRLGVQYMSLDLDVDDGQIAQLKLMQGHTKLMGTYLHANANGHGWKDQVFIDMYKRAVYLELDLLRLLNVPASRQENDTVIWFTEQLKELKGPQLPCIAYNVGPLGRTSQMMNSVLTSVTHPSISDEHVNTDHFLRPLLSSENIISALFGSYIFDPLHFYVVGANVSGSVSPAMHNAAYHLLGLKHKYSTRKITTWEGIEELAKDDTLGGLSIVQPYKVKLVGHMHALSGHAKAIGALNTLIPLRATSAGAAPALDAQALSRNRAGRIVGWFGDNTDFIGILNCVKRSLSPRNAIQPRTTSLVIGAGGMARAAVYAMLQIGCKHVFVYNRTIANTLALARHFNELLRAQRSSGTATPQQEHVRVIERRTDAWPTDFAPPTIVVSCVTHELLDGNPGADFEMPDSWLQSPSGGVVVEMAYMTKETPLIKQMKQYRETTRKPWVLVDGIETLIEQAVGQFESMTGRKAPKRCMADAAYACIRQNTSYLVDGEEFFT